MSTTPGDSTWADAGLLPVDATDPADLAPVDEADEADELEQGEAGAITPTEDPVQRFDASEGDVLEQQLPVPDDGTDDYRG